MGFQLFHLYLGFLVFGVGYAVVITLLGQMGGHSDGSGSGDGHDGGLFHSDGSGGGHDAVDSGHDFAAHGHDSSALGHDGDGGGHGHNDGTDSDHGSQGLSPFSPLMIATFATLFGGLGFISLGVLGTIPLMPQSLVNTLSFLVSGALSVILSSYFSFFLVKLFIKSQASTNVSTNKLIGSEAEALLDLEPGKIGEITYLLAGSRQSNMARLAEGEKKIKKGQTVEIVAINDNVMLVKPVDAKELT